MYKTITTFLILLILMMTAISQAQTRSLNCGRFGMDVNSTGTLTDFQWPRDFIYANNGGGGGYDILIEDWNKPGGNQDGYAVPGDVEVGTWTTVYNVKRIKYPYPTIMVDGNDISSTDEYDGDAGEDPVQDRARAHDPAGVAGSSERFGKDELCGVCHRVEARHANHRLREG